ncbi:MAG: hypothetical protein II007_04545 [Gammaproteobacteria bacterium]|nr:hypothetical protein [Gammaproteobacteria bacterium]
MLTSYFAYFALAATVLVASIICAVICRRHNAIIAAIKLRGGATTLVAEAMAIQARAETLRAGLAALEADWCQEAQSHFRTAERQEDEFAKRFCQNGGTCYANCVIGLRELLARVDGAGDLRAQAVEQDAKRP